MNMNQDGSDERTPPSRRPTERTQSLPCVMSLRLLDSKEEPIVSQLAAFAKSYDEAVLHALGAFPKHLPPGTPKSTINLKYPCRAQDGTVYWSGLQVARDSREIWMRLMTSSGRIPEIGVFVEGGAAAGLAAVLGVTQPALGPLIGENGVQIKMRMYDRTKLRWIMPMGDSTRAAPGRPPRIPPPPRYQEFHEFVAQRLEASYPLDHPSHKGIALRTLLQLKIWDQEPLLNEENYREKMQSCAINDVGQDRSVQDYVEIYVHYSPH